MYICETLVRSEANERKCRTFLLDFEVLDNIRSYFSDCYDYELYNDFLKSSFAANLFIQAALTFFSKSASEEEHG